MLRALDAHQLQENLHEPTIRRTVPLVSNFPTRRLTEMRAHDETDELAATSIPRAEPVFPLLLLQAPERGERFHQCEDHENCRER